MGSPATSPPLAQDGYQWEGIWVQILPWQTDCIIVQLGDLSPVMKVETVVEPGGKNQAHLALVPPEASCFEKL